MSTMNPSAMLAESLSEFSKAAYQAFSEVEAQSRMEVARIAADIREAKLERDKAFKELHVCQLETQSWKQEAATSKSALSQAELTIAHQADTLAVQLETISQLRREVTQWKDQSRNWQEHFLRVEQERCAQSSRIDELVVERLQYPPSRMNSTALFTPKASKYTNGANSAPSSITKRQSIPSPTQPPEYKSAAPPSPLDFELFDSPTAQINANTQKRNKGTTDSQKPPTQQEREIPSLHANGELEDSSSTAVKRPRKSNTSSHNAQKVDSQSSSVRSTVIRRVQAVVNVKREDDSEDESPETSAAGMSLPMKKKEESIDQQRYLRTPRPRVIHDDADDGISDGSGSGSISDGGRAQGRRHPTQEKGRFRQRSRINYREEEDEDEEEDELMMGAEENHDEVYGTQRVEVQDSRSSKKQPTVGPPAKKRKLTAR